MDHLIVGFLGVEMRNVQGPDRIEYVHQGRVDLAAGAAGAHVLAHLPEEAQNPRPIEPLSLAMFAEAHGQPQNMRFA